MKLRNFEMSLKRDNLIKDLKNIISTAGAIGTLTGTTSTYTNVNGTTVSGASINSANARFGTKLVIPTTAYTGSAPDTVALYVTGSYIFVGDAGAWKSAALASG